MSQPFTFQAANNRSPLRIGQIVFTILALLAFAVGSLLLSLLWFGVGVTITGKVPGAEPEVRGFVFIIVWPVTMLARLGMQHHCVAPGEALGSGLIILTSCLCHPARCLGAGGILHAYYLWCDVHGVVHSVQHRCDLARQLVSEKHVKVNV